MDLSRTITAVGMMLRRPATKHSMISKTIFHFPRSIATTIALDSLSFTRISYVIIRNCWKRPAFNEPFLDRGPDAEHHNRGVRSSRSFRIQACMYLGFTDLDMRICTFRCMERVLSLLHPARALGPGRSTDSLCLHPKIPAMKIIWEGDHLLPINNTYNAKWIVENTSAESPLQRLFQ